MPRTSAAVIENSFVGGLKTEFTGLNFPENSATDTSNCVFSKIGRVTRRKGIDIEATGTYTQINRTGVVVNGYVWKNVAGDGRVILVVEQIGSTLRFYEASNTTGVLSSSILASSINLDLFKPVGSTVSTYATECQYAQGNGYLFVFHPNLEPFYVTYEPVGKTVVGTQIVIQVRDFAGINEGTPDTQRPTVLTVNHLYNLGNQGWPSGYRLVSSTSTLIGTGSKTFIVNSSNAPINNGDSIQIYSSSDHAKYMTGIVTSFSGTTLVVNVTAVNGAGTFADWNIVSFPDHILTWNDTLGNYPSNSDVWWTFKNSFDYFDPASKLVTYPLLNKKAPTGHYIVDAFNVDRSTVSGVGSIETITTGGIRPSTGTFFQGRVFYTGVNYSKFNSNIYFSQILDNNVDTFGKCYQANDPTAEDLFDLLPSDGGVISIQGIGDIIKIIPLQNALVVFASNGIWIISGSLATGFTANDYTVSPVSLVRTLSHTSFVQIQDTITWWNVEGIYTLSISAKEGVKIDNLVTTTIADFFANIPNTCKTNVRGYYNPITFIIQWIYRSTDYITLTQKYEFDSILNFNTVTSAFYPWIISNSALSINGILVLDTSGGNTSSNRVVRGSDLVKDVFGNQVVTLSFQQNITAFFKYIISKVNASTYDMSFGEEFKEDYLDWSSLGTGVDYPSYFVTGFAVHGDAQRFFQSNYIYVYSDFEEGDLTENGYTIQGRWNYANTGDSGKFTSLQRVLDTLGMYDVIKHRFKIRGRGLALQLRFANTSGKPFSIIGWSKRETANAGI